MMAEMKKAPETREIAAASIRDRWSGYPSSGLTPRRLATILREADTGDPLRQMELFSEMEEKDAHLYSCLQTRKLSVSGLDWDVIRKGTGNGGQEVTGFIKEALGGIDNFEEALLDLLDAVGKGYSISEIMWTFRDGSVVPSALKKRQQKRFTFMEKGGVSERPCPRLS